MAMRAEKKIPIDLRVLLSGHKLLRYASVVVAAAVLALAEAASSPLNHCYDCLTLKSIVQWQPLNRIPPDCSKI